MSRKLTRLDVKVVFLVAVCWKVGQNFLLVDAFFYREAQYMYFPATQYTRSIQPKANVVTSVELHTDNKGFSLTFLARYN